ncbi:hypothetical protein CDAR_23441 [Caerostris darwini]|uniref:Uncharacterized protein n=1 Tax=Caerostris darwini TaxID=1538125 RepID=A0AAV4T938_9ARAC|nr:hypothetical protein CDAR_23391 [Caerostris darwini]GIY41436.1 hypothetical protein CDAR_23411 [Caerostris darwini]GIY41442.1 hypothetical protein CDAR_23441 [Caerostris darwini]
MLADFAFSNEMDDPYELMYEHSHLSSGCDKSPSTITDEHENYPVGHLENVTIVEHISDKKLVAKNAVESVFAKLLIQSRREANCQYINRRCKEIGNDIQDHFTVIKLAKPSFIVQKLYLILKLFPEEYYLLSLKENQEKDMLFYKAI